MIKRKVRSLIEKAVTLGSRRQFEHIDRELNAQREGLLELSKKLDQHDFRVDELKQKVQHVEGYQPIYGVAGVVDAPARESADRCSVIEDSLGDIPGLNILDIGSSLGYVSFYFADRGAFVDGWESNLENAEVARLASQMNGIHAHFLTKEFNKDTISTIPANHYDVVMILSVLHHIIRFQGLEQTKQLVSNLLSKIPVMIVELAKKGEDPDLPWDKYQPENELEIFDGLDVDITKIGEFGNHLSDNKRPLYKIQAKKVVEVNNKLYTFTNSSLAAYSKSPLRRMGSFRRKYYFSEKYIIKEYGLSSDTEKHFNIPEVHQEISSLSAIARLTKKSSIPFPVLVDVEVNKKFSRIVLERLEGDLLSDISASGKLTTSTKKKIVEKVIQDVLNQLIELKKLSIYHNDIRSWNIIVGSEKAVLIDYGNAAHIAVENDLVSLAWAVSGFLTNSREVPGDQKKLPKKQPFDEFEMTEKYYSLLEKGTDDPAAVLAALNQAQKKG